MVGAAAAIVLDRLLSMAGVECWNGDMIKILVARAAALEASGATVQALPILTRALQLAEPSGYIRVFLNEGESVQRLFALLRSQGTVSAYIYRLLAAFSAGDSSPAVTLADPLSERETMVLVLLASGLSSSQIAQELIVALSTVRTHIKHIYTKLDVHTRHEAIARARTLRLIP